MGHAKNSTGTLGGRLVAGVAVVVLVVLAALGISSNVSWPVVGAAAIGVVGLALWAPSVAEADQRASFGAALATGAVISGMFFVLSERDTANQNRIASRDKANQDRIAAQAQDERQALANRQQLELQLIVNRNLSGVDLGQDHLAGADFSEKNLTGSRLASSILTGARFFRSNLTGADLHLANLTGAYLRRGVLDGAFLPGATLTRAVFDEAYLNGANLGMYEAHRAVLENTSLLDADLRGACLAGADLQGARLGGADLAGADLDGADLGGAKLTFAELPVNLQGASIAGWKIDKTNLRYVNHPLLVTRTLLRTLHRGAPLPKNARTGRLLSNYDGQTADIAPLGRVRLIGVTVPNLSDPYGKRGEQFLAGAFGPSGMVRYVLGRIPRERRPGNTGRWLIYAWNSHGTFVNGALLANGYAVRRHEAPELPAYAAQLDAAQRYAKAAGKGVWTLCPEFPP